ncbi:hypothetical protein HMPREF0973_01347 [Prevotella veroralis F0319]|uniref:Uncharacterized protein n=1 Tax=Prevotella veroralis F0319 TaxID=649761 RepID=C9MP09_9BACT|nr:hypothetical protein HMPREF0973_01347 [Prevotella veroralis F0319]
MKRRLLHSKETPSSNRRGRLFLCSLLFAAYEVVPHYTRSISSLHIS